MKRLWSVVVVLAFVLAAIPPGMANAQDRCFPETNQCTTGRFGQYWEQNGGLPVFGFPITGATNELNRDTGQTYLTQWFERNRFEAHPENQAPYDVLLGRLGDDRLRQLGRDWQAEPRESGPQANCRWFAQTGHNVCNQGGALGFRAYWESHGLEFDGRRGTSEDEALALFGLPLTEPRMETNASGDNVLTQWFERARFEWHPGNPDQFKVLLGLLGAEVRGGGSAPPPGPTPTAPPAPGPTATPALPPASFNNCQADPQFPNAPNYPVKIVAINKFTEVVQLQNVSAAAVDLSGWTMCSIRGNQTHTGIGGVLQPGQTRDFQYGGPDTIWNNEQEDDGALYNANGQLVSYLND